MSCNAHSLFPKTLDIIAYCSLQEFIHLCFVVGPMFNNQKNDIWTGL